MNAILQKPKHRVGWFQARIIADIVFEAFFQNANSLGPLYREYFNMFPNELIAFVLTAVSQGICSTLEHSVSHLICSQIRHALQKWETGRHLPKSRRFSGPHYKVYDQFLDALKKFDESVMQRDWQNYRQGLWSTAL